MKVIAPAPQSWGHIIWHFSLFLQLQCPHAFQQKVQQFLKLSLTESKKEQCLVPPYPSLLNRRDLSFHRPTDVPGTQRQWECTDWDLAQAAAILGEKTMSIPQCWAQLGTPTPYTHILQVTGRAASHVSICPGRPGRTSSRIHHYILSITGDPSGGRSDYFSNPQNTGGPLKPSFMSVAPKWLIF